jgi:hypothetical protein
MPMTDTASASVLVVALLCDGEPRPHLLPPGVQLLVADRDSGRRFRFGAGCTRVELVLRDGQLEPRTIADGVRLVIDDADAGNWGEAWQTVSGRLVQLHPGVWGLERDAA